jgi:hypothetical protein
MTAGTPDERDERNGRGKGEKSESALSPSDLDIADSQYVAELEAGRYVVSTDNSTPEPEYTTPPKADSSSLSTHEANYVVDIEISVEGHISNYRTASDDIVSVFSDLVRWYATQVDGDLDPSRVLQILIAESDLSIGPHRIVNTAVDRHGLTPKDSIADLLYALETHR